MKFLLQVFLLPVLLASLISCATYEEMQTSVQPQAGHFKQTIAYVDGQIAGLRDLTALTLNAQGADCKGSPNTDICVAARKIDVATKEFLAKQDLVQTAYGAAGGVLADCKINYGGVVFPCEDTEDQILAALLQLKTMLPKGDTTQ